jgi:hypothetical protein
LIAPADEDEEEALVAEVITPVEESDVVFGMVVVVVVLWTEVISELPEVEWLEESVTLDATATIPLKPFKSAEVVLGAEAEDTEATDAASATEAAEAAETEDTEATDATDAAEAAEAT